MILFLTFLSLFLIITPFLYFLHIFNTMKKSYRYLLASMTCLCSIMLLIKIWFKPPVIWFSQIIIILQFYILTVFVVFLMILLLRLFHYHHKKSISVKVLCLCFAVSLIVTGCGYHQHFQKRITSYQVHITKNTQLSSLKIAFVSDLHLGNGSDISDVQHLAQTLHQKSYDLLCLGGDLFDETTPHDWIEKTLQAFSSVHTQYGIFAINGNHEHYVSYDYQDLYQKYKIHFLKDHFVCIDKTLNIIGREDVSTHQSSSLNKICQDMDTSLPTIVLDHNPQRYQNNMTKADLQLSGHTHAGQVFPGNLITHMIYDNDYGLLETENFSCIVSSGFGSWGFPLRLMTQCEYVEVNVSF